MIKNRAPLIRYAAKLSGPEHAEDIFNDSVRQILVRIKKQKNDEKINNMKGCAMQLIKYNFLNRKTVNKKYAYGKKKSIEFDTFDDESFFEERASQRIDFIKLMDIAHDILTDTQLEAIKFCLQEDCIYKSPDGRSPETIKTHRRNAILRLREYIKFTNKIP